MRVWRAVPAVPLCQWRMPDRSRPSGSHWPPHSVRMPPRAHALRPVTQQRWPVVLVVIIPLSARAFSPPWVPLRRLPLPLRSPRSSRSLVFYRQSSCAWLRPAVRTASRHLCPLCPSFSVSCLCLRVVILSCAAGVVGRFLHAALPCDLLMVVCSPQRSPLLSSGSVVSFLPPGRRAIVDLAARGLPRLHQWRRTAVDSAG